LGTFLSNELPVLKEQEKRAQDQWTDFKSAEGKGQIEVVLKFTRPQADGGNTEEGGAKEQKGGKSQQRK